MVLDIQLSFHPPLVKNPEPDWLADRAGEHFDALRLFHEACWAWASFQTQRSQPYTSVRWGNTIASKADLYDYAIDCRRQALLNGFFLLTIEQLDELASLPDLSTFSGSFLPCVIGMMRLTICMGKSYQLRCLISYV